VNEPFLDVMDALVANIRGGHTSVSRPNLETDAESIRGGRATPGLTFKRGPIKKPERALQKLVRVYAP
jgi:hypothetical protein